MNYKAFQQKIKALKENPDCRHSEPEIRKKAYAQILILEYQFPKFTEEYRQESFHKWRNSGDH